MVLNMLNYIRADLYKTAHRPYLYVFEAVLLALVLASNLLIKFVSAGATAADELQATLKMLLVPVFLVLLTVDVVTGDDMKEHSFKNTAAFGAPRLKLYLSHLISSILIALILTAVTLLAIFGCAFALFSPGKNLTADFISQYFLRLGAAALLYIAAICVGTVLAILIKNNTVFAFAYAAVFLVPSLILQMLAALLSPKWKTVYDLLITSQVKIRTGDFVTAAQIAVAAVTAVPYIFIFTLLGLAVFSRQEFK